MTRRARPLYRSDIRQRADRPTNSVILQYVGQRRLTFDEYIYGYPDGTFFVAALSEVPYPESLEQLADKYRVNIDALVDAPRLKQAVVEALATEAMVKAPELLDELAEPQVRWQDWDRRELERRHRIALARVGELTRLVETDIKLRAVRLMTPEVKMPDIASLLAPEPPPVLPRDTGGLPAPLALGPREEPCPPPTVIVQGGGEDGFDDDCLPCDEDEADSYASGSRAVQSAAAGVAAAREAELPQRLPQGARRRLKRMPPAAYIIYGDAIDPRRDLCAAMSDARAFGRKGRETAVVDWDGEWPVVARRYGQSGRTVYKVESVLKRQGIAVEAA